MRFSPRRLLAPLVLACLGLPAGATWSVVLVNRETGEVSVATATCIANEAIRRFVPVVRVGRGVGAAQYIVDPLARNKKIMWEDFAAGFTPEQILDDLLFGNGLQPGKRQYGLAGLNGPAATWSGGQVGPGKNQLTGELGPYSFAVQGNSLTGPEVIQAAWEAIVLTDGDTSQRLLAAMGAAARLGGDGRCSCSNAMPISCGVPPPMFRKSAHTVVMIAARMGDTDGACTANDGCATGDYWLDLEVIGGAGDPDPIAELEVAYLDWRASRAGHPDGVRSRAQASAESLPADGVSTAKVVVHLLDIEGAPLTTGGATLAVAPVDPLARGLVEIGPVSDRGDGSYAFAVRAGRQQGAVELAILADDGAVRATLHPPLRFELGAPAALSAGLDRLSAAEGRAVPFTISVPDAPRAPYLLLGSASGSRPGLALAGTLLPLVPDPWLAVTLARGGGLERSLGALDADGRALATWQPDPRLAALLAGQRLTWAALVGGPALRATNAVEVEIVP